MYVRIYVCIYARMHACMCVCIHTNMHTDIYIHAYTCMTLSRMYHKINTNHLTKNHVILFDGWIMTTTTWHYFHTIMRSDITLYCNTTSSHSIQYKSSHVVIHCTIAWEYSWIHSASYDNCYKFTTNMDSSSRSTTWNNMCQHINL